MHVFPARFFKGLILAVSVFWVQGALAHTGHAEIQGYFSGLMQLCLDKRHKEFG